MKIWPFNRKKRQLKETDDSLSFAKAATKKSSRINIIGSFIAAFLVLGAGATGIGISASKQVLGSEFSKSYNVRFELSPYDEQSYGETTDEINPHETFAEKAKSSADAYSRYLHEKGIDDVNVYPEWIPKEGSSPTDPTYEHSGNIFINAVLPNDYYYNNLDEKREEIPSPSIYMNDINSSRLTAIIQRDADDNIHQFSVIPLNQYIDSNTAARINSKNPQEVQMKLTTSFSNIVDSVLDNENDDKNHSQIYIVRNYNELLNYMLYILQVEYNFNNSGTLDENTKKLFNSINDYFVNGKSGEQDFYNAYRTNGGITNAQPTLQPINVSGYGYHRVTNNGTNLVINDTPVSNDDTTTDALLYWMSKYENSNWSDPSTTVNYSFLNQYILAFGQADKKTPASDADIPANSFLKIIPNKNPTNTKEDSNFQWLTINTNSRYEARQVLNGVKNFAFELPLKVVNVAYVPPPSTGSTGLFNTITNNISTIEQPFSSNVFGMKPIVGLVVSLGLILLGIGILISILYRVPGAFGIASIIATFGLTLMIMVLSNYVLSMGLFIGLLIGLFGATIALFSWCERIKKIHRSGVMFDVAVRKGVKRGFLPAIDIHAILLVLGVCVSYFGTNQIAALGNTLLIFSIISLVMTVLVWALLTLLLFNNKIGFLKLRWFFRNKKESMVNIVETKNYETTFQGKFETKKFTVFGWKQILCASVVLTIAILGVVLILAVGVHSSYLFYGGSRVITTFDVYNSNVGIFAGYSNIVQTNGLVYLYYDHTFDTATLGTSITLGYNLSTPWASVQAISAAGAIDYVRSSVYVLLIASGLLAAYALVRLNWVSVIAVFAGLIFTPLLVIGVVAICQIYFDIYIVMAIVIIYAINAMLVINFVGTINNQWVRKQIFVKQDLRKIINCEIKNSLWFYAKIYAILIASFIITLLFVSKDLIWFSSIILIGVILSTAILYGIVPVLLYWFIGLRYRYLLSTNVENPLLRKNFDVVDEQLIDGINKFKRKRPTL